MRIAIVRHGKAEQDSATGRDEDRRLKGRGEKQACFLAAYFGAPERRPGLIITSRYDRAFDTARVIQKATACPLQTALELEVGHAPSEVVELMGRHGVESLVIVGHNPQLSELVWLLEHGAPAEDAGLRTGEAVVMNVDRDDPVGSGHEVERVRMEGEE